MANNGPPSPPAAADDDISTDNALPCATNQHLPHLLLCSRPSGGLPATDISPHPGWVPHISFCPDIPSVSPYTFLGLYTCTVGTSFREIYCDKRHLLRFACPNQYFACPTRPFILAHQHKALFFLREIPRLKLIVLRSIRSFVQGLYLEKMGMYPITDPNGRS
jgi:hypothetical protein